MQLGIIKQDVTPPLPIGLAGFAHRKGLADWVYDRIFIRTFLFTNSNQVSLIIVADYIWWDTNLTERMKEKIEAMYQIPKSHILFHATHNHSSPQMSARFSKLLGEFDLNYLLFVEEKILHSIQEAWHDLEEVTVFVREGVSAIGVNRRKKVDSTIQMVPNIQGSIDNTLKVFTFLTEEGGNKAMWIHYSCHPTCTDENIISGEFTGFCCRKLEERYPECTVAYLQGFCGDIRPALIRSGEFYRGSLDDMVCIGESFLSDVQQLLRKEGRRCLKTPFEFREKEFPLVFQEKPLESEIPDALFEEWPKLVQQINGEYLLKLQYIKICKGLELIACNAELVHAYGLFLKQYWKHVLPLGYSNGMVGYIPTAKQLEEGGYEAEESIFYFGYPNKLDMNIEICLKEEMKSLIGKEVS